MSVETYKTNHKIKNYKHIIINDIIDGMEIQ